MYRQRGFTLVELAVVTAIIAILASVGIPSYINYRNRAIQAEAIEALLRAKMDQELFWAENNRYANSIGCLPSFGDSCDVASHSTPNDYLIQVVSATTRTYRVRASRTFYGKADTIAMTESTSNPVINNPQAIEFSVFRWLFD